MPSHLLLVSLGPVQDFIAAARRCQDLWFGSFLLSELSRAAASGIETVAGPNSLIFPGELQNEKGSVANKILALLPDGIDPKDAAQHAEKAMQHQLLELWHWACGKLKPAARNYLEEDRAKLQLADLMELQWAAVPLPDPVVGYAQAHRQIEQLLAWRKNTKDFGPVPWHTAQPSSVFGIPKSSLDGHRESVLREQLFTDITNDVTLYRYFYVRRSERLCGVGLLKRIGEQPDLDLPRRRPVFHSSSHIAAGPLRARIKALGEDGQRALRDYHDSLKNLGLRLERFPGSNGELDGVLLFASRMEESFLTEVDEAQGEPTAHGVKSAVKKAAESLGNLLNILDLPGGEPVPYYAMLVADGDRMGKAIERLAQSRGAELNPELSTLSPADRHRELSRRLCTFATQSSSTVLAHEGSLIYAGGDDVMALLPLHRALACARALKNDFSRALADLFKPEVAPPTLSVGIGIAHHLDLMDDLRALARNAEKDAKKARNSLAIRLSPRSGGMLMACGSWAEEPALDARIDEYARLLTDEQLPDSVAFDLEEAVRPLLIRPAGTDSQGLSSVAAALAKRVLTRKQQQRGHSALDKKQITILTSRLTTADPVAAIKQVSAELQLARHFAKAYEQADPKFAQSQGVAHD